MTQLSKHIRRAALVCAFFAAAPLPGRTAPPVKPKPPASAAAAPRVLMLSGGFDLKHNQVAIESNVRYVSRLLPPGAAARVLFTDGSRKSKTVLYEDAQGRSKYRTPQLPRLDGPNTLPQIKAEFQTLASGPAERPVLLYVTGHGSPSPETLDNNVFDLWNNGELSVRELAAQMKTLPASTAVTAVMVECFSGSFGNLLFEGGDPNGALTGRDFCGFYASISARPAAGCTPAINEADYHDFTGYFFSALSGQSRLGKPVTGADYNHDGRVGMDEAFAYSLIHDDSIDTPVCTSDVFLRRFASSPGDDWTETNWTDLRSWATPAQKAALEALSDDLTLKGDGRLAGAYADFTKVRVDAEDLPSVHLLRFVRLARTVVLAHRLQTSDAPADAPLRASYAHLTALEAGSCL